MVLNHHSKFKRSETTNRQSCSAASVDWWSRLALLSLINRAKYLDPFRQYQMLRNASMIKQTQCLSSSTVKWPLLACTPAHRQLTGLARTSQKQPVDEVLSIILPLLVYCTSAHKSLPWPLIIAAINCSRVIHVHQEGAWMFWLVPESHLGRITGVRGGTTVRNVTALQHGVVLSAAFSLRGSSRKRIRGKADTWAGWTLSFIHWFRRAVTLPFPPVFGFWCRDCFFCTMAQWFKSKLTLCSYIFITGGICYLATRGSKLMLTFIQTFKFKLAICIEVNHSCNWLLFWLATFVLFTLHQYSFNQKPLCVSAFCCSSNYN